MIDITTICQYDFEKDKDLLQEHTSTSLLFAGLTLRESLLYDQQEEELRKSLRVGKMYRIRVEEVQ